MGCSIFWHYCILGATLKTLHWFVCCTYFTHLDIYVPQKYYYLIFSLNINIWLTPQLSLVDLIDMHMIMAYFIQTANQMANEILFILHGVRFRFESLISQYRNGIAIKFQICECKWAITVEPVFEFYCLERSLDYAVTFHFQQRLPRHALNSGQFAHVPLIRPSGHLVPHSTGHLSSRSNFSKEMKYSKILNQWYNLWILFFWYGPPRFDLSHLKLAVTGLNGPPTSKS